MLSQSNLPLVGVIIPVFKHSRLLSDAIASVISQRSDFSIKIILINDGCSFSDTHQTCLAYSYRYPEQIDYLYQPNSGLSSARNRAIDYILSHYPAIKAVFFLDADNKILPSTLARSWQRLNTNSQVNWVYPDIETFGLQASFTYDGPYSLMMHAHANICEAGSLVGIELFQQGLRFDETMKNGFEDWDFWLSAAKKGFRGTPMNNFGFRYRHRAESMLADSNREKQKLLEYIQQKHQWLFNPKHLLTLEHHDTPRYCIYDNENQKFLFATNPSCTEKSFSLNDFMTYFWQAQVDSHRLYFPPFMIFCHKKYYDSLWEQKLLHSVLWHLEEGLEYQKFSLVIDRLTPSNNCFQLGIQILKQVPKKKTPFTPIIMIRSQFFFNKIVKSPYPDDQELIKQLFSISGYTLKVTRSQGAKEKTGAIAHLLQLRKHLRDQFSPLNILDSWQWRRDTRPKLSELPEKNRHLLNLKANTPCCNTINPNIPGKRIAFLLPYGGFGGVDRATYLLAEQLKKHHWIPFLFITHHFEIELPEEFQNTFASIDFLNDPDIGAEHPEQIYAGTALTQWGTQGRHDRAISRLSGMDVVVNCQTADLNAIMGPLKNIGITTVAYIHVADQTKQGRPVGHPFQTLAFEHAYHLVLTCSNQMKLWFQSMGIPADKLLHVKNAPGYHIGKKEMPELIIRRQLRLQKLLSKPAKLKILFLGRFDTQKGLDRLIDSIKLSKDKQLGVKWKIVGKAIINDSHIDLTPIKDCIYPPIYSAKDLTSAYTWADIIFLPSRWEGVPLSILEAMRLGCIPLATDVGAVKEVVTHGYNGILLENAKQNFSEQVVAILSSLIENPDQLEILSQNASEYQSDWSESCKTLLSKLGTLNGFNELNTLNPLDS